MQVSLYDIYILTLVKILLFHYLQENTYKYVCMYIYWYALTYNIIQFDNRKIMLIKK